MFIIKIIFEILLIIWQIPQLLISLIPLSIFFFTKKINRVEHYKSSFLLFINLNENVGAFCYGKFIFIRDGMSAKDQNEVSRHEYGHSIQSMILGPFYIFAVIVPSIFRFVKYYKMALKAGSKNDYDNIWADYYKGYPEDWADKLGGNS